MKTKVEINGYEITIEESEGLVSVKAEKEGEVIEEFTLEPSEGLEDSEKIEDEDIKSFGDFGGEEEDFEAQDEDEDEAQDEEDEAQDEDEDESQDEDDERALESFQSFIRKRKK